MLLLVFLKHWGGGGGGRGKRGLNQKRRNPPPLDNTASIHMTLKVLEGRVSKAKVFKGNTRLDWSF